MKFLILIISSILFLSACGGGGGGSPSFVHDVNNVPTCSDTGTDYQTSEYHYMSGGNSNHGLSRVCASTAYANGYTGQGVDIAVLDTGIAVNSYSGTIQHYEFGDDNQSTPTSKVVLGIGSDAANQYWSNVDDSIPEDRHGHGTHVASIVAGVKDDYGMHGVAYNARLYPIKMMDPWGVAHYATAWAYHRTISYDVDIANHSYVLGDNLQIGDTCNSRESCESFFDANHRSEEYFYDFLNYMSSVDDIMQVFAAGNDSLNNPNIIGGSCIYDNDRKELCVIVAALGIDGKIADYSNRCGLASSYCISAPGSQILAASWDWINDEPNTYERMSGTSMASPMVAGGLALIKEKFTSLTNQQIIDRLFATAIDHDVYSQSSIYGHGLMDLGAATSAIGTLQLISNSSLTLDQFGSTYLDVNENSFAANSSYYAGLKDSLKNKTIELYDSFDRGNFTVYLDSFFVNDNIMKKYSISNHLNNLLMTDNNYEKEINHYGTLRIYGRDTQLKSAFISNNKKLRISTNMSSNPFFYESSKKLNINSKNIISKFFENPYFYNINESFSLNLRNGYLSSDFFIDENFDNTGLSINLHSNNKIYQNKTLGIPEISFGLIVENKKILDSYSKGYFHSNDKSYTKFASLKYKKSLKNMSFIGNLNYGSSKLSSSSNSYLSNRESIITRSFTLGVIKNEFIDKKNNVSFLISQPQKVIDGSFSLTVPTSSNNKREVNYTTYDLNLVPNDTEINYDILFSRNINKNNSLFINFTHIKNPIHDNSHSSINNASVTFKKLF